MSCYYPIVTKRGGGAVSRLEAAAKDNTGYLAG